MVRTFCLASNSLFETGHNVGGMVHCRCLRRAVLCSAFHCKLSEYQKETPEAQTLRCRPRRTPAAGLFSCLHFVDLNKMVDTDHFADVRKMVYQFRGDTNMMTTICVTSRKWSVRYALPPSCSSAPLPPLLTEMQNGSQELFCAKEERIQGCSRQRSASGC